jgi:hypothetical protein
MGSRRTRHLTMLLLGRHVYQLVRYLSSYLAHSVRSGMVLLCHEKVTHGTTNRETTSLRWLALWTWHKNMPRFGVLAKRPNSASLLCQKKNAIFDELWMEAHEHDRFHRVRVAFDDHWLLVVGMLRFSWQQTSRRGGRGVPIDFFVRNRRT